MHPGLRQPKSSGDSMSAEGGVERERTAKTRRVCGGFLGMTNGKSMTSMASGCAYGEHRGVLAHALPRNPHPNRPQHSNICPSVYLRCSASRHLGLESADFSLDPHDSPWDWHNDLCCGYRRGCQCAES